MLIGILDADALMTTAMDDLLRRCAIASSHDVHGVSDPPLRCLSWDLMRPVLLTASSVRIRKLAEAKLGGHNASDLPT